MSSTVHIPDEGLRRALSLQAIDADEAGHVRAASLARLEQLRWTDHGEAEGYPDLWMPIEKLDGLEHCEALRELSLSGNELASLEPLASLRKLEALWLGATFLRSLEGLGDKPALLRVDLRDNPLTDIGPLRRCPALTKVDLAHTKVADLSPLLELPALQNLSLFGVSVDPDTESFAVLQELMSRGVTISASRPLMQQLRDART